MKAVSAVKSSTFEVFSIDKYVIVTDGTVVTVYSDSNWTKPQWQFSVYEYVKTPTAVGVVNLTIDVTKEDAVSQTPSKKAKIETPSTPKKKTQRRPLLCIGTAEGTLVFVCFLTQLNGKQQTNYKMQNDHVNGKSVSPVTCIHSNDSQVHFGHENGQITSASLIIKNDSGKIGYSSKSCHQSRVDCIASSECNTYLVTSVNLDIFVWDIVSEKILHKVKPFHVHVTSVRFVSSSLEHAEFEATPTKSKKNKKSSPPIVVAASRACRQIASWTWSNSETPRNINLSANFCHLANSEHFKKGSQLTKYVSVCNFDGSVEIIDAHLKAKSGKPMFTVKIVDSDTKSIIPVFVSAISGHSVVLYHGIFPEFVSVELVNFSDLKSGKEHVIETLDPTKRAPMLMKSATSVVPHDVSKLKKSTVTSMWSHEVVEKEEPSLIELLTKMTSNAPTTGTKKTALSPVKKITAGSRMAKEEGQSRALLLIQCLSSNDKAKLNEILTNNNRILISETVQSLSGPQISVLTGHLFQNIDKIGDAFVYVWLREILLVHFDYLQSCKSLKPHFDRMRQLVANEMDVAERLKCLKAKLEITLSHRLRESEQLEPSNPSLYADDEEEEEVIEGSHLLDLSPEMEYSKVEHKFSINELKPDKPPVLNFNSMKKSVVAEDIGEGISLSDSDD